MLEIVIVIFNAQKVSDGYEFDPVFLCVFALVPVSISYSSSDFGETLPRHLEWFDVGLDEGKMQRNTISHRRNIS